MSSARSSVLALVLLAVGCPPAAAPAGEVRVFVAASLAEPLREVAARSAQDGGPRLVLNVAASSALERQVEAGAPCDVFVSAAPANVDRLIASGALDGATRREVARNALVVIVPAGAPMPADLPALVALPRVAVGQRGVPVGDYARDALERSGLPCAAELAGYPDEPAVLSAVAEGAAPAGIVYASSLVVHPRRDRVARAFAVDPALHAPIVCVAAARKGAGPDALALLERLAGAAGAEAFARAGLVAPGAPVTSRP